MSKSVADLVNEAMARKRRPDGRPWGPYQLMGAIGLLEGDRPFNITQVQRLLNGERRTFSRRLITRLIEALPFTDDEEDELWHAAELWPDTLDLATYRRLKRLAATSAKTVSPGKLPSLPVDEGLDALILPLRPTDDRRRLWLVPDVAA